MTLTAMMTTVMPMTLLLPSASDRHTSQAPRRLDPNMADLPQVHSGCVRDDHQKTIDKVLTSSITGRCKVFFLASSSCQFASSRPNRDHFLTLTAPRGEHSQRRHVPPVAFNTDSPQNTPNSKSFKKGRGVGGKEDHSRETASYRRT